jgi:PAS domain S-box-containing protein
MSKESEDRVATQLRLFEALSETTPDFLYVFDLQGRFLYANRRLLEVWGISIEHAIGKSLYELGYPKWHADMHMKELSQVIETKRAIKGEVPFTGGSGISGVYEYIFSPVLGPGGQVEFIAGTTRDVTDRRQAQETFYNLIQNNPFGMFIVDADFRLRQVSLGAQKVFANVRPLLERDFAEVLRIVWPEPFASEAIGRFRSTLTTGDPFVSATTIQRRQDTADVEAYDWRIERVPLPDGRLGVACYFYDLSERQRWEAALRASGQRNAARLDAAIDAIISMDHEGRVVEWNPAAERTFGYARAEAVGREMAEMIIPANLRDPHRAGLSKYLATGVGPVIGTRLEITAVRRDGTEFPVELSITRVSTDGPPMFTGFLRDISERKTAEAERERLLESERIARANAEHASRMKDEFLTTLSHELRTPLNAILGWSQILTTGSRDSDDLTQGLQTIERNARAQTQIIEDLLDMSRIVSGKVRLDVQRIELAPIVQAAVDTVRPAANAKGVRLQIVLDPLTGSISGDPNRLQQVFWNLLTNAVKFTPKGGRVQVLLERVNSHLEVNVIDTGEGISPEFLPYVFDRFRQADASTTRRHGGLGIGLAIVKQLLELHGGSVRASSPGKAQGATFTVSLPLTVVHAEPDPSLERRHPRAANTPVLPDICDRLAGLKVLVVDDEPDARALVKRLLEECQAVVIVAASAAEALERLLADRPDVLVSDIGMPEEDGYALIKQVRALGPERGGNVPAVALTAYARAEDRINAVVAGFQMHVAKPVEPAELITVIAALAK